MPKALFAAFLYPPESAAAAKRAASISGALEQLGYEVEVLTMMPNYPTGEVYAEHREMPRVSEEGSVRVRRLWPVPTPPDDLVRRLIAELRFCGWAFWRALRTEYDVLLVTSPSMFLLTAGWLLKLLRGKPWLADVRDLTWLYLAHVREGRLKRLSRMLERVMLYCLKHPGTAAVTCATPGLHNYFVSKGVDEAKVVTCLNGISHDLLSRFDFGPKLKPGAERCVTFVGNLGYNYDLEILLELAGRCPKYSFRIVGDGPQRDVLEAQAANLSNVTLTGHVSRDALAAEFARADVFFCSIIQNEVLNQTALPVKVFEYMAAGRPFLYQGQGLIERFVTETPAGVVVPEQGSEALVGALEPLFEDAEAYATMACLGRRAARSFEREGLMLATLKDALPRLLEQRYIASS